MQQGTEKPYLYAYCVRNESLYGRGIILKKFGGKI
jgi:hypothetical protein